MKPLRRVLFYITLFAGTLLVAVTVSVFLYKDRIINQFIKEANKQLNTPVTIKTMDVSLFNQFPLLSIVFNDVYVEDSHPGQYPLLTAKKISFQLNPLNVWRGDYTIKGMKIHDSETYLKINAKGDNNYTVIRKQSAAPGTQSTIGLALSDVLLKNTTVHYVDMRTLHDFTFTSDNLVASIHSSKDIYEIKANGQLNTDKMMIGGNNYLAGKSFGIESHLT